jgi:hypothetical protein
MKVKVFGVVIVTVCMVGLVVGFLKQKPESIVSGESADIAFVESETNAFPERDEASSSLVITDSESNISLYGNNDGFKIISIEDLKLMPLSELEFYLSDFRFSKQDQDGFEQSEADLLMAVFKFSPEVVMSYVSEYFVMMEDSQLVPPKIVGTLLYETSEAALIDGFNRYLDAYHSLPVDWLVVAAMRSEMADFFETGSIQSVPPVVSEYALNDFLNGKVNQYPLALGLNPLGTITDEQLIEVFLKASPKTIDSGMDELIFDVIALNDARTYGHLIECLKNQPKKLNIYRQLKDVEGIPLRNAINEAMANFESLSEKDKVYFSLMALDYGDISAFTYLLNNPVKNFSGPVDVNIAFVLKRKIVKPESGVDDVISWAQERVNEFHYDSVLNKFVN